MPGLLRIILTTLICHFVMANAAYAEIYCLSLPAAKNKQLKNISICCEGKTPGMVNKKSGKFTSIKKKKGRAKKRGRTKKLKELRKLLKRGNAACKEMAENPGNTSTPTPYFPPYISEYANFDKQGNATERGKECFEIPPNLSGNVFAGELIVKQKCVSCPGEHLTTVPNTRLYDRAFPYLREATSITPMNLNEKNLPDGQLADITAYLNQFRYEGC